MSSNSSRAEMRFAAIYAAFLCTACVLALNVFVLDDGANHSALFGTWIDKQLQRVSATWVALVVVSPIGLALIRQALQRRFGNTLVLIFCLSCAFFSVCLLVIMLQD